MSILSTPARQVCQAGPGQPDESVYQLGHGYPEEEVARLGGLLLSGAKPSKGFVLWEEGME